MKNKSVILTVIIIIALSLTAGVVGIFYVKKEEKIDIDFELKGKSSVILEYGEKYEDEGFIARTPEMDFTEYVKIDNNLDPAKIGNYRILYDLTYKSFDKSLKRDINVVDTVPPVILLKDCETEQYVTVKSKINNCDYVVDDNYDKDINERVKIDSDVNINKKGDYTVKYTVTDSSGNTDSKEVNIHVRNKFDMTYIKVSISKQRLKYYQNNKLVLETPITSGRNNATKTGTFKIRNKVRNTSLKGKDYVSYVKYWMAYDGNNYGIHDASWRSKFGTMDYKTNGSHGCVNVPTTAMSKLYSMVEIGTPVYIEK